jgi:hypothetical protein
MQRGVIVLDETLLKMEKSISGSQSIGDKQRRELLELVDTLRQEVRSLAQTHGEQAQSIAGFAQVSAHEATREVKNARLMSLSLEGLSHSVGQFEATHPRLVGIVNEIHRVFASIGLS